MCWYLILVRIISILFFVQCVYSHNPDLPSLLHPDNNSRVKPRLRCEAVKPKLGGYGLVRFTWPMLGCGLIYGITGEINYLDYNPLK